MDKKVNYYLREIDQLQNNEFVFPVTVEIDPSNNCMLNCSFCMFASYLKKDKCYLKWETYVNLLDELRDGGTRSITFTGGGSPLMHKKFNAMVDLALSGGFEVGLVTNGVMLDKVENPEKLTFIRVSLDASNPEMYKKIKGKNKFKRVVENVSMAIKKGATVGLSYVVCKDNKDGINSASKLAEYIDAAYIQFKPAWLNGKKFFDYKLPDGNKVIKTPRYKAYDDLPCKIASLIGIVGANGHVYYCCQYRGNDYFDLGSLEDSSFGELMRRKRPEIKPDISKCPQCRYMNYARAYKQILKSGTLFFKHKNFL